MREHLFYKRIVFRLFDRIWASHKTRHSLGIGSSEASILAYWADVIATFFAIRILQYAEGSSTFWNLAWPLAFSFYLLFIVFLVAHGTSRRARADSANKLPNLINGWFKDWGSYLVYSDCLLWTLFAAFTPSPSGILVLGLYLMTASPLIEDLTVHRRPLKLMLRRPNGPQVGILLGCATLAMWCQTKPAGSQFLSLWSVGTAADHLVHGFFYGLIVNLGVIIIVIWRSAERQSQQYSDLNALWRQIRAVVHDTKNEALAIGFFHKDEIRHNLSSNARTRLGNTLDSVLGIWLVVNPDWYYTMRVKPADADGDITPEIVQSQVRSVLESALASKAIGKADGTVVAGPDADAWDTASSLVGEDDLDIALSRLVKWETSEKGWRICPHGDQKIPDHADVGLLYTCIAEMTRNALRHNDNISPEFLLRISDDERHLRIEVKNKALPEELNKLTVREGLQMQENAGLASLESIARVFGHNLRVQADEQERTVTVCLEVSKALCQSL